ncbi:hypothetical protein BH24BAC1_BH24BAC1_19490 [soil metagenome]
MENIASQAWKPMKYIVQAGKLKKKKREIMGTNGMALSGRMLYLRRSPAKDS